MPDLKKKKKRTLGAWYTPTRACKGPTRKGSKRSSANPGRWPLQQKSRTRAEVLAKQKQEGRYHKKKSRTTAGISQRVKVFQSSTVQLFGKARVQQPEFSKKAGGDTKSDKGETGPGQNAEVLGNTRSASSAQARDRDLLR